MLVRIGFGQGQRLITCVCVCLQGMEALQSSGKVKSIGVSNFSILQLERLLSRCKVPPAVNQVAPVYLND